MKHCFAFFLLAVFAVAPLAVAEPAATQPATTQPAAVSLLSNSDFKTDNGQGAPAGWPVNDNITWLQEGDVRFLHFVSPEPGKMVMSYRQLILPEPHPPALEIHVRARSLDLKVGQKNWFDGRVMLQYKDADGKVVKAKLPALNFKGTSKDWIDKSAVFAVPARAHLLEVMPCLFNVASGSMDISTLEILTSTADKLPPPPPMVPSQTMPTTQASAMPPELHVQGNQLQTSDGKFVWLQGLCVDSLEWSAKGEHIAQSIPVAIDQWHSNVIRLPVRENFWFGWGPWQKKGDNGMTYRKIIDDAVNACAARGAYLVLDLHTFGAPTQTQLAFWKDAAVRYKNNPAVIFELFNEPHDISWKVWRNGGNIHEGKNEDVNVKENTEVSDEDYTPGMQALVDAVRSTGAKNLIIAGGLDWSYNLSGILKGYALKDQPGCDGIMYSSHIYPWKKDWQKNFLDAAAQYPIFIGEVGCPQKWEDFKFIKPEERYETLGPNCTWPNDMIAVIQKYKLNWTGFSFHPHCGPMVISDWNYTPTPYWGIFVKEALAGQQFTLQRLR
jgi:hypothetical protein